MTRCQHLLKIMDFRISFAMSMSIAKIKIMIMIKLTSFCGISVDQS